MRDWAERNLPDEARCHLRVLKIWAISKTGERVKQTAYKLSRFFIAGVIGIVLGCCFAYVPAENSALAQSMQEAQKVRLQKLQIEAQKVFDLRRSMAQRLLWDWGGSETTSISTYDDPVLISDFVYRHKRRTMKTNNFNLWGSLNLDEIHSFYLRLQGQHIDYNRGDQYRSSENQLKWNLEEGVGECTYIINIDQAVKKYFKYTMPLQLRLTAGRFNTSLGSQLAYTKKTNGVQLDGQSKWVGFKIFAARNLIDEENIDFSVPGFRSSKRYFYGGEVNYKGFKKHAPYLFALIQEDRSGENIEDLGQDYDYDSRYYGIGSRGQFTNKLYYSIEGIMEGGKSNPEAGTATDGTGLQGPPDVEHIDAWAFDASLHYSVNVITHPNLSIEYAFGSGDSDRSAKVVTTTPGNKEGTTDRNFLNFGYIDTGLSLAPRLSNLQMFKFGLSMTPSEFVKKRNVSLNANFFLFRKDKKESQISDNRAVLPQRNIGKEIDISVVWNAFSDLNVSVDYGRFYPGAAYYYDEARDNVSLTILYQF